MISQDKPAFDGRTYAQNKARWLRDDARDIGAPPEIVNQERRDACEYDLCLFLKTYFPEAFALNFSADHNLLISNVQHVITDGGQLITVMPRGSGKTTILQRSVLWATLYAHRRFTMLIGPDSTSATRMCDAIKTLLETNSLLNEDFPEICHPVRSLDGISNRANYQTCGGVRTGIQWGKEHIQFPETQWTKERGNAWHSIKCSGLEGSGIRGSVVTTSGGEQIRPDCVLIDDPQTRKTARSQAMTQTRLDLLNADILEMAGPTQIMAALVAATVIYQNDLAERLLDNELSPQWKPHKVSMLASWPKRMNLWEKYSDIRRQELLGEVDNGTAGKYYLKNRKRMDEGAEVYWEDRVKPGFHSAIENAMSDFFTDPKTFMAEKMNSPSEEHDSELEPLKAPRISKRQTRFKKNELPNDVELVTAFIDVQQRMLYWMICGWSNSMGGYVLNYGTNPDVGRDYFTYKQSNKSLAKKYDEKDISVALRLGVADLIKELNSIRFKRPDGAEIKIARVLVDARFRPADVEAGIIASAATNATPSFGVGIRAKDVPLKLRKNWKGTHGHHWIVQKPQDRTLLSVFIDTNYWKSQTYNALAVNAGHPHAVYLYKAPISKHSCLADHLTAERAVRVEARGRSIDEWELEKQGRDNHWLDCLVGSMVAASVSGLEKQGDKDVRNHGRSQKLEFTW